MLQLLTFFILYVSIYELWPTEGHEHPAYAPKGARHPLPFIYKYNFNVFIARHQTLLATMTLRDFKWTDAIVA